MGTHDKGNGNASSDAQKQPARPMQSVDAPTELAAADPAGATALSEKAWLDRVIDERYRIVRLLGRGGMGAVFEAEHLKLRKRVAFKVVRAELAGNGEVAARFAREAMATAQFEHPHVASALDFGTLPEGGAYFVMQLVRGKSLAQLLEEQPSLPWPKACELAAQVADALSAAETAGIVHRDLKPENILIENRDDGSDLVRILDFGIARVPQSDATALEGTMPTRELTRLGTIIGTPGYMAPEQALGAVADHRADLYALGVVLWESVVGQPLWDAPDVTALLSRQLSEPAPSLKRYASDKTVPVALDTLVAELLIRTPEDRPAHAADVRDTLRHIVRHNGAQQPLGQQPIKEPPAPAPNMLSRVRAGVAQWRAQPLNRRRIQVMAALTAGVLFIIGGYLAIPTSGGSTPRSTLGAILKQKLLEKAITPERTIPREIEQSVDTMLHASRRSDRRAAAKKVLYYQPASQVVQYILDIAELETARGCQDLRKAILALEKGADLRSLPTLQRFSDMPKTGCGFLRLEDCYRCVRQDLRDAVAAIVEKGHSPPKEP